MTNLDLKNTFVHNRVRCKRISQNFEIWEYRDQDRSDKVVKSTNLKYYSSEINSLKVSSVFVLSWEVKNSNFGGKFESTFKTSSLDIPLKSSFIAWNEFNVRNMNKKFVNNKFSDC